MKQFPPKRFTTSVKPRVRIDVFSLATSSSKNSQSLVAALKPGSRFTITSANPPFEALSLTSSGISTVFEQQPMVGSLVDTSFDVAPGIHSEMLEIVTNVNFGIVHVIPTGGGAEIQGVVAHKGVSVAVGLDITLFV